MVKNIIFDFDGTICDSVEIKTEAFVEMYAHHGKKITQKVRNYHIKNGGMSRFDKFSFFNEHLLNKKANEDEINKLSNDFSELVVKKVINAPYITGAYEFILKNNNNFFFYISTATPLDEINLILKKKNIDKYFFQIFGSPTDKKKQVEQIIIQNKCKKNETIFVGDSTADYKAAKYNEILFVQIGSETISGNNLIIKNFLELEKVIENLN